MSDVAAASANRDGMTARRAIFTIVANNYLHFARTLLQSARASEPSTDCYCVLVDRDPAPSLALAGEIKFLHLHELGLPRGSEFTFQYPVMELCTAVKPWALVHLLDAGYTAVVYLDPDIFVYRPLEHVYRLLADGADLVLTPHLLAPVRDARKPGELEIRQTGAYNLGFCAVRNSLNTREFLAWWQTKLARDCVVDVKRGIFVDQTWIDLVPGLFPNVTILRHPGYNVAYWNLAQRPVTREPDGSWSVLGCALVFFHFSGFDPLNPETFSRHQDRFGLQQLGPARELVLDYAARLVDNGAANYKTQPYGFGAFHDGTPLPASLRKIYRGSTHVREQLGGDPFAFPQAVDLPDGTYGMQWYHQRRQLADYPMLSGFSSIEANVSDEGIWVSRRASILFGGAVHGEVALLGAYFPQPVEMASGRRDSVLSFWCGTVLMHQCSLLGQGDFEIRFTLPAGLDLSREMLRIDCSGWFVPRDLGINAHDPRNLAWRLKRLAVGDLVVVDHHRLPVLLAADDHSAVPGVNLVAYAKAESGVGEAARCWARAAAAACIPFSIIDVGYQNPNWQRDASVIDDAVGECFDIDMVYVNADQTPTTMAYLARQKPKARISIGFWHWEQPELPQRHMAAFDGLAEVWVPSAFVHDAVSRISPVPVFKVPHAIEFSISPTASRARFGLPESRFLVLIMYDFHSYQARKNPQAAVDAFRLAFAGRSDVALVVKTVNADKYPREHADLQACTTGLDGVVFLDHFLTRQELYDLQACCDCMLSLHRAEGFGLGLAEMMYLGKPVVATGWSGNMEFMTPMNSFPVEYELRKLVKDNGAYEAGQEWAEADTGHAADCLRRLVDDPGLAHSVGERAAIAIRQQLSPLAIGKRYRKRLSHLAWANADNHGFVEVFRA